ncbi:MAG: 4-hydroxy-tetrahydrodipicolinate reductase [Elusimicrobia bacterium]|nr:4-hydroxy-tetrahydrodipicolinate reductase [Elusimicrobiota bacterium]
MASPLRIVLSGAGGRMGRAVAAAAQGDRRFRVIGGVGRGTPDGLLLKLLDEAEVLIDFSLPAAALGFAAAAAARRVAVVSGTTGLSAAQGRRLKTLARRVPVFWAPNMSPGMSVLADLARRAAAALPGYEAAVIDIHHAAKKDAPSGSAKRLQAALAAGGMAAPALSLRVGDVAGDHTVVLAGPGERLELVHRAHSREVFARGALRAARWLAGRRPGLYGMSDLLAR